LPQVAMAAKGNSIGSITDLKTSALAAGRPDLAEELALGLQAADGSPQARYRVQSCARGPQEAACGQGGRRSCAEKSYGRGTSLGQVQNAKTPVATITKAMNDGQGCARKASTINQTETAKKS